MDTMGTYRRRASYGKRQEFVAMSELLKRGHDVYQTLVDDQGIDCVVRKVVNGKPVYIDLQIKARSKDCLPKDAARFAGMKIEDPRQNLFFMFYSDQVGSYWIIPSLQLVRVASRNKKGRNVGKYHILLSGIRKGTATPNPRFDEYKDKNAFRVLENGFRELGNS